MKFKYSAPTVLILMVVFSIATQALVSNRISSHMTASSEAGQFAMMSQILQSELTMAQTRAAAGAEIIAAIPTVKEAFAARNREQLLEITKAAYRIQQEKYGFSQAQFHALPSISFLRVHNPAKFGEDLASYRPMIVDVNRNIALRKGIEITTSGIGIFGTVPMTDAVGSHTGSFEMAFEFGPLLDSIKTAYGLELAVYIDEKMLRETATSLKGDVFNEQNRVGSFVKFHSTHSDLLRSLVTAAEVNVIEDVPYVREAQGVSYGVLLQPLYNYAHKQIGVIAAARNFSATRSSAGQAIVWQGLLALMCAVILIGAILIVLRGMLLQPLSQLSGRFDALVGGDASQAMEETDGLCDEMQHLAQCYESLRKLMPGAKVEKSEKDGKDGAES